MAKSLGNFSSLSYGRFVVPTAIVLAALFPLSEASARTGGIAGFSGKTTVTCTDCHNQIASIPTVAFGGGTAGTAAPTSVVGGSTTAFTFTINGGPATAASLDIAASGGTLATVSPGTKISPSGEVVHTAGAAFPAGGAKFTFNWTAPAAAGTYTLFGAGLSSNGTGSGGDGTATAKLVVTVTAGGPAVAQNLVAMIVAPATGVAGTPVSFDASTSTAPVGSTLATYDWNFGDNTAGSGAKSTHTYVAGTYTVTLKVTSSTGATASVTKRVVISPVGSSALSANAGGPYTAMVGSALMLDASASTAPGGSITSYAWDFGDNTSGTGVKPSHVYTAIGNYVAIVSVTDNTGAVVKATASVAVTNATGSLPPANQSAVGAPRLGQRLYDANCASCHGATGAGSVGVTGSIIGVRGSEIADAILDVPEMQTPELTALTETEVRAISHFLRGEQLYQANCESCHGVGGAGTANGIPLIGESATDIANAIANVPEMQTPELADLSKRQLELIAFFLPRDPLAAVAVTTRGIRADALGSNTDSAADYPDLDLAGSTSAAVAAKPAAAAAGSLDWLAIAALGAFVVRRKRK